MKALRRCDVDGGGRGWLSRVRAGAGSEEWSELAAVCTWKSVTGKALRRTLKAICEEVVNLVASHSLMASVIAVERC
jgi:hypothetical protein